MVEDLAGGGVRRVRWPVEADRAGAAAQRADLPGQGCEVSGGGELGQPGGQPRPAFQRRATVRRRVGGCWRRAGAANAVLAEVGGGCGGRGVGAVRAWGQTSGRESGEEERDEGRPGWSAHEGTVRVTAGADGGPGTSGLVSGGVHQRCVKVASLQGRIQVHPSSSVSVAGGDASTVAPVSRFLDGPDFGGRGAERAG